MENVNHPKHYNQGRIEVIEFLEDQFMSRPHEWNAVKYLSRSGRKDSAREIEDLEKAIWYIRRKIELLKASQEGKTPLRPNDMNEREGLKHAIKAFPTSHATMIITGYWIEVEGVEKDKEVLAFASNDPLPEEMLGKTGCILFTPNERAS